MSIEIRPKVNSLLRMWPNGVVMTSRWLFKHGYSPQLIKKYVHSGWVRSLSHCAYTKLNDVPTWPGGVYALQQQLELPMHIGGISALELHGFAQYLSMENAKTKTVSLYNTTQMREKLPKWFVEIFSNCIYRQKHLFKSEIGLEKKEIDKLSIMVSSPERAILEVLTLVPQDFDYHHAYDLCENLQLLRPDLMQRLLQECLSVKVKRLFLYLADKHELPCFSHLDILSINLGKGKRAITPGGHFISRYQLAVPKIEDELENGDTNV